MSRGLMRERPIDERSAFNLYSRTALGFGVWPLAWERNTEIDRRLRRRRP